jgi:hypothetical protein
MTGIAFGIMAGATMMIIVFIGNIITTQTPCFLNRTTILCIVVSDIFNPVELHGSTKAQHEFSLVSAVLVLSFALEANRHRVFILFTNHKMAEVKGLNNFFLFSSRCVRIQFI